MKFNKIKKMNIAKQKGGLCLTSCNMDKGAPFHAKWDKTNKACENFPKNPNNTYAWLQEGGLKKKSKKQKGGLCLKSCNMDTGAPFHATWKNTNKACINVPKTPDNTYAWLQEGGLKKKKSKKQKGGLCLKSCNMDDGAPYHAVWNKNYSNCNKPPTPPKE